MTCGRCRTDSDCPAGQGCVANRETRRFECMASDCEEDAHCFPGFACRAANGGDSGPIIRRCTPEGVRREGETCDSSYISRAGACREGLRCVSGICTVPCRLDDPASCPTGYLCKEGCGRPGLLSRLPPARMPARAAVQAHHRLEIAVPGAGRRHLPGDAVRRGRALRQAVLARPRSLLVCPLLQSHLPGQLSRRLRLRSGLPHHQRLLPRVRPA